MLLTVFLRHDQSQDAVAQLFARYDFIAAPVVDEQFGLLGIVTHDANLLLIYPPGTP